jgi:hypothetical protein
MKVQSSPIKIRDPFYGFYVCFLAYILLYSLYTWGCILIMEEIMKDVDYDSKNEISIFLIFFTGTLLVILNKAEVKRLKKRIVQLRALIELYEKGLKELKKTFKNDVGIDEFIEMKKKTENGATKTKHVTKICLINDILVFFTLSLFILVAEQTMISNSKHENIKLILRDCIVLLEKNLLYYHGLMSIKLEIANNTYLVSELKSMKIFNLVIEQLQFYSSKNILDYNKNILSICASISKNITLLCKDSNVTNRIYLSLSIQFFDIIYFLFLPFALWITQGYMTFIWSLIIFICFGPVFYYRIYIGDFIRYPTNWDYTPIQEELESILTDNTKYTNQLLNDPSRQNNNGPILVYNNILFIFFEKLPSIDVKQC